MADEPAGMMTVTYQGERFLVPAIKPRYTMAQASRVEELMRACPAPAEAATYADLIAYHDRLEAPGCGSSTGGFGEITRWGQFTYLSVQLPLKKEHRVIVYYAAGNDARNYRRFDDFVMPAPFPPELRFQEEADGLAYYDVRARAVVGHRLAPRDSQIEVAQAAPKKE